MVWFILILIGLVLFCWYCFGVPDKGQGGPSYKGTVGDTVAENFTPEEPGEHWEIVTGADGKEHFADPEDKGSYGLPNIPPEAGA